jgi:hypothetical protein
VDLEEFDDDADLGSFSATTTINAKAKVGGSGGFDPDKDNVEFLADNETMHDGFDDGHQRLLRASEHSIDQLLAQKEEELERFVAR